MRQIHELRQNLYTLDLKLPEYQVRSLVVIGERRCAVWDTLTHAEDMAAIEALIGDKDFYVIYSHADWDHIWGTAGFTRAPLNIVAHERCLRRFHDDVPHTLQDMQEIEPGKWDEVELRPPDLTFRQRLSLDLGGVTLDLHVLPGHTADSIVAWLPEWGALLGGDAIETPLPVINDAGRVPRWTSELAGWARRSDLRLAIPSHGRIDSRHSLDATLDYLRRLQSADDIELPTPLDAFYQRTHETNLSLLRGGAP